MMKISDIFAKKESAETASEKEQTLWYKKPWVHRLIYALIALVISITMWGYVLMSENPSRSIRIQDIPVTFEAGSESDLYSRDLTILGDIDQILPSISVTVSTTLNDLPRFKGREKDVVKATVSLNSVHKAGEYVLDINVTTSIGEIDRISTENIVINVDNLVERTIPVSASLIGELPENYWHGDLQLLTNSVQIRGAESELQSVVKASCYIDLTGKTESINDSFALNLYDAADEQIVLSSLSGSLPAVTAKMNILPCVTIPLSFNFTGQNSLKDIYEITQTSVHPSTVTVAADEELLKQISELISLETIDIGSVNEECSLSFQVKLLDLPENVILVNGVETYTVTIEIRERIEEITLEDLPIEAVNEQGDKFTYVYSPETCSVTLRGKASLIRNLYSKDISLLLNMAGKEAGTYTLIPELELVNGKQEYLYDLEYTVTSITCIVETVTEE